MARKVFISFLGTTDYYSSEYYRGNFCSREEKYVQIAALEYIQRNRSWTENDRAYILLTEAAESRNWNDNGYIDRNGISNVGLEHVIDDKRNNAFTRGNFVFPCEAVRNVPEGKNETEIWEIFKIIYERIQDGDELYFDITHGFRYLPMLVVVLGNYAKFLKNVRVMHIIYGNYEGRDKVNKDEYVEPAHAPLVDLQPFSTLQDWTYAVADFINNGNADRMYNLTRFGARNNHEEERTRLLREMVSSIQRFVKDMQTCRGNNIISGTNINEMRNKLAEVERTLNNENAMASVDELLTPILGRISETLANYSNERDVNNGFQAVGWCIEHRLYQQAITILLESVKNYFMELLGMDMTAYENRESIKGILVEANNRRENHEMKEEIRRLTGKNECWDMMRNIASYYNDLRELRNDFNHFGCNDSPNNPADIEENIRNLYASITEELGIQIR